LEIVAPPQLRHIFPDKTHAANVWVFPNSHSPAGYATGAAVGTVVGVAVTHAWSSQQLAAALSDAADCQARALHDPLTGLPNRRAAIAEVNSRLADPDADTRGFLLALLDLDDFKTVNDTHGHPTGDDLLTVVSARLRVAVAPGGFVARLGGDEFVVLVPDHGGDPADTFTPVLAQLAQPVRIGAATLRPHACAGVATATGDAIGCSSSGLPATSATSIHPKPFRRTPATPRPHSPRAPHSPTTAARHPYRRRPLDPEPPNRPAVRTGTGPSARARPYGAEHLEEPL
jgi:diguanylate cyclase